MLKKALVVAFATGTALLWTAGAAQAVETDVNIESQKCLPVVCCYPVNAVVYSWTQCMPIP